MTNWIKLFLILKQLLDEYNKPKSVHLISICQNRRVVVFVMLDLSLSYLGLVSTLCKKCLGQFLAAFVR